MADSAGVKRPATVHRNISSQLSTVASREDLPTSGGEAPLRLKPSVATTSGDDDRSSFLRADSLVSRLSSELTASESGGGDDLDDRKSNSGSSLCTKCGAKKPRVKTIQGRQRVVCGRCGSVVFDT